MSPRKIETTLAHVTLAFLAVFAPLETVVSWPYGLTSPYYLVDAIAIVVMGLGAVRSLRARPASAPSVLTVGWAWAGANFWRASLARSETVASGGKLSFGSTEMTLAVMTTALAMSFVAVGIWLIMNRGDA